MLSASEPKPTAFTQSLSVDFSGADQPCTPPQDGAGFALNTASELDTKVSKGQGGVQARKFMNRQGDKGEERKDFFFPSTPLSLLLPLYFLFRYSSMSPKGCEKKNMSTYFRERDVKPKGIV